jgi:hypothetical protein
MKRLNQELNTFDDSFTYTVVGEVEPIYWVDSNGYLISKGVEIGKFRISGDQWQLHLDTTGVYMTSTQGLFKLPEFELKALTALVNG